MTSSSGLSVEACQVSCQYCASRSQRRREQLFAHRRRSVERLFAHRRRSGTCVAFDRAQRRQVEEEQVAEDRRGEVPLRLAVGRDPEHPRKLIGCLSECRLTQVTGWLGGREREDHRVAEESLRLRATDPLGEPTPPVTRATGQEQNTRPRRLALLPAARATPRPASAALRHHRRRPRRRLPLSREPRGCRPRRRSGGSPQANLSARAAG